jgi:DeoR family fructose operon transcriptional repressor
MIVYQRQQRILEYLETKQSATIRELARLLYTSESSVRRDIATLEIQGCVQKTYGGVLLSK